MKKGWRVEVTWRNFTAKTPGGRGAHFHQWSWSFPTWAYCKASYTGLLKETAVSWPFTSSGWSHSETAWPSSTADSSTQYSLTQKLQVSDRIVLRNLPALPLFCLAEKGEAPKDLISKPGLCFHHVFCMWLNPTFDFRLGWFQQIWQQTLHKGDVHTET